MTNQRLIENKVRRIVREVLNESGQPELDKIARSIADATLKSVNKQSNASSKVTSPGAYAGKEFPYKSQYVLEMVIEYLQEQV